MIIIAMQCRIPQLLRTKERIKDSAEFFKASADDLPVENASIDVTVSGLALNFFPDPQSTLAAMKRISKPCGIIAAYVWDYADRIDFLRSQRSQDVFAFSAPLRGEMYSAINYTIRSLS